MRDLLVNGGFAGEFYFWHQAAELQVARGWAPWWLEHVGDEPAWKNQRPSFRQVSADSEPHRVRLADSAQSLSTPWATHLAGLWQQVPVPPEAQLRFAAWGHAWSSKDDHSRPSSRPTNVRLAVGLDPTGGTDPFAETVIWSRTVNAVDEWALHTVQGRARAARVTLFLRSAPNRSRKNQVIYWDEAQLECVDSERVDWWPSDDEGTVQFQVSPTATTSGPALGETSGSTSGWHISVLGAADHVDAGLIIRTPRADLALPMRPPGAWQDGKRCWEYQFEAAEEGRYLLLFGSDGNARALGWRQLIIGDETIESVGIGEGAVGSPPTYRSVYVLLPPTADLAWAQAAMRGAFPMRRTVGFSADDAGIGGIDSREVIAVNPHHWPEELTADWFRDRYPDVRFYPLVVETPAQLARVLRSWRT
jgi:hypothetical protein